MEINKMQVGDSKDITFDMETVFGIECRELMEKVIKGVEFADKNKYMLDENIDEGRKRLIALYDSSIARIYPDLVDYELEKIMQEKREERETRHNQNFDNAVHHHDSFGKGLIIVAGVLIFAFVIVIICMSLFGR